MDEVTKNKPRFTYVIEYVKKIPSKRSYSNIQECADVAMSFGQSKFGEKLLNVKIVNDGQVIASWRQ